jgi:hypothetical protein
VPEIEDCLRQVMAIRGALGASLIEYTSGMVLGSAGRGPNDDHDVTAAGATRVIRSTVGSGAFASVGRPSHIEDITITAHNGYHLIHVMRTGFDARLVLYVWLDRELGNLAMTLRSLRSITGQLVAA